MIPRMSKDDLVRVLKQVIGFSRAGKYDESYTGYRDLFSDPEFLKQRPEDMRQALRLMVHAKPPLPSSTPVIVEAHRAAVLPLTELVSIHDDPGDYELLGMCHLLLGNVESASRMYRAGLAIERTRNPQSDLCGTLMRRVAEL
jgi:hypothetical protein